MFALKYRDLFYKRTYSIADGHYTLDIKKATTWKTRSGAEKALTARKEFLTAIGRAHESAALQIVPTNTTARL